MILYPLGLVVLGGGYLSPFVAGANPFVVDLLAYLANLGIVVYPYHLPQGTATGVVFSKVSGASEYQLSGLSGIREVYVQFTAISSRYTDCETYLGQLKTALDVLAHATIGSSTVEAVVAGNEIQDWEPGVDAQDDGTHSLMREYCFHFDESK